ncbi:hypothetical protein [Streptomyces sp. WMMB303]|uniref:hypothetical protein n=1 Tax=Streptomyces sp. WMMB303 TaxID=3034154 RepID=UPI0023EB5185|nr:hypothetical protein [Streptomyces sp. WMMB303]MDF4254658.1 hypothetical protein [Streptomyces sp. WMMB303]MDF4254695.1 hypothetical protein [Streptomyces sp. WMMB303]
MNEPVRFDPTDYLLSHERQITAPHLPGVAALPPTRSALRVLWEHLGRIAPGLVTTAATALAWGWHAQMPAGSTQPLWISGLLAAFAAAAGTVSAAKKNGSVDVTRTAFAGAGTLALIGVAAWTPLWTVRVLMWLLGTAAVYAVCAPLWRSDRRLEQEQRHEQLLARTDAQTRLAVTAVEQQARVAEAQWQYRTEAARAQAISTSVEALVAANEMREQRAITPGNELNVAALLQAAGHEAPRELAADERDGQAPR